MTKFCFPAGFAAGADISWTPAMEAAGYTFRDASGKPRDLLELLKTDFGLNAVRLRTWVDPDDDMHHGQCSTEATRDFALRAIALGYDIMVDFHYSDTWADPGHQVKPKAWENLHGVALEQALYDYTYGAMCEFVRAGCTPRWVQIGNETNPGMLFPDGAVENFRSLARLYEAGYRAVKDASPSTAAMIHLAEGDKTDLLCDYFRRLAALGCPFDMIGLSFYPYWLKLEYEDVIGDLRNSLDTLTREFGKPVMIVEVGGESSKPERSLELMNAVLKTIAEAPPLARQGIFYWEPAGAMGFSHYPLSAWQDDGRPGLAMDAYKNIRIETP